MKSNPIKLRLRQADYREIKENEINSKIKTALKLYMEGKIPYEIIKQLDFHPFSVSFLYSKLCSYLTKRIVRKHQNNRLEHRKEKSRSEFLIKIAGCTSNAMAARKLGVSKQFINFRMKELGIPSFSEKAKEHQIKKDSIILKKAMRLFRKGISLHNIADLVGMNIFRLSKGLSELRTKRDNAIHNINYFRLLFEKRRKELRKKLKGYKMDKEAAKKLGVRPLTVYQLRKKYGIPKLSVFNKYKQ